MYHDQCSLSGQVSIRENARDEPAPQTHVILPAVKGHVAVSESESRRSLCDGQWWRIFNPRSNVNCNPRIAESEDPREYDEGHD